MTIELTQQIFNLVIVPLLAILTAYIISFLNAKKAKIAEEIDNETIQKYIGLLNDIIIACVVTTNQTYVNELKEKNAFTIEAQKEAFEKTFNAVKAIISEEMVVVLSTLYEDLDLYIAQQIEFMVYTNKSNFTNDMENFWRENPIAPPIDYTYNE